METTVNFTRYSERHLGSWNQAVKWETRVWKISGKKACLNIVNQFNQHEQQGGGTATSTFNMVTDCCNMCSIDNNKEHCAQCCYWQVSEFFTLLWIRIVVCAFNMSSMYLHSTKVLNTRPCRGEDQELSLWIAALVYTHSVGYHIAFIFRAPLHWTCPNHLLNMGVLWGNQWLSNAQQIGKNKSTWRILRLYS